MFFLPFTHDLRNRSCVKWLFPAVLIFFIISKCSYAAESGAQNTNITPTEDEKIFLDRLMVAESGGSQFAANQRSSARGPFQFVASTFLDVMQRNFPELTEHKTPADVLQLRVEVKVARDAALAYSRENAAFLSGQGVVPKPAYLRLAFFTGPAGAIKVITAKPGTPVSALLSASSFQANPFLNGMNAGELVQRSEREANGLTAVNAAMASPKINIRCDLRRASCRKWLYMATKRSALASTKR